MVINQVNMMMIMTIIVIGIEKVLCVKIMFFILLRARLKEYLCFRVESCRWRGRRRCNWRRSRSRKSRRGRRSRWSRRGRGRRSWIRWRGRCGSRSRRRG